MFGGGAKVFLFDDENPCGIWKCKNELRNSCNETRVQQPKKLVAKKT